MRKVFLFVVVAGAIVLGAGLVTLGAFPPAAHVQTVVKVLPNDHFAPKG